MACRTNRRPLHPAPNLSPDLKSEPSSNPGQFVLPVPRCDAYDNMPERCDAFDSLHRRGACDGSNAGDGFIDGEEVPPADRAALMADTVEARKDEHGAEQNRRLADVVEQTFERSTDTDAAVARLAALHANSRRAVDDFYRMAEEAGPPPTSAMASAIPPNEAAGNVPAPATTGPTAAGEAKRTWGARPGEPQCGIAANRAGWGPCIKTRGHSGPEEVGADGAFHADYWGRTW